MAEGFRRTPRLNCKCLSEASGRPFEEQEGHTYPPYTSECLWETFQKYFRFFRLPLLQIPLPMEFSVHGGPWNSSLMDTEGPLDSFSALLVENILSLHVSVCNVLIMCNVLINSYDNMFKQKCFFSCRIHPKLGYSGSSIITSSIR